MLLKGFERLMNASVRHCQRGFTKGKSRWTNLIAFCDPISRLAGERKAVDVFFWILVRLWILPLTASTVVQL